MKFPTSSSAQTVSSNNAILTTNSGDSLLVVTTSAQSTNLTSSSFVASEQQPKIGTENSLATNFTNTAGNFFRRYTSSNTHEMTPIAANNSTTETIIHEDRGLTSPNQSSSSAVVKKVSSSSSSANATNEKSKPGRAVRSRKVTRAPQPPSATTKGKKGMSSSSAVSPNNAVLRPCQTHSFHTDAAEVEQMETVLLKLLDDFNSGKLRAFGQGCSMEQMSSIRDQQESLAKLHFEIGARQDPAAPLSEEGLRTASENMDRLMGRLEKLSVAIGQLNPASSTKSSPTRSTTGGLEINFGDR